MYFSIVTFPGCIEVIIIFAEGGSRRWAREFLLFPSDFVSARTKMNERRESKGNFRAATARVEGSSRQSRSSWKVVEDETEKFSSLVTRRDATGHDATRRIDLDALVRARARVLSSIWISTWPVFPGNSETFATKSSM